MAGICEEDQDRTMHFVLPGLGKYQKAVSTKTTNTSKEQGDEGPSKQTEQVDEEAEAKREEFWKASKQNVTRRKEKWTTDH